MDENKEFKAGFGSDFSKDPIRVVFITKKTSAKVKGTVRSQLMTYPNVLLREAIAFQLLTVVLVLIALFWNAPLEQVANPIQTPNPAKAPWYFLGLQELLHYFPPIIAGVLIPALVVIALIVVPYFNINIHGLPLADLQAKRRLWISGGIVVLVLIFLASYGAWTLFVPTILLSGFAMCGLFLPPGRGAAVEFLRSRSFPWWVMTWFIVSAVTLTIVGTFFRGPGWSWVWPWR